MSDDPNEIEEASVGSKRRDPSPTRVTRAHSMVVVGTNIHECGEANSSEPSTLPI